MDEADFEIFINCTVSRTAEQRLSFGVNGYNDPCISFTNEYCGGGPVCNVSQKVHLTALEGECYNVFSVDKVADLRQFGRWFSRQVGE